MSNTEFEYYAVEMQVRGRRRLLIWRGNDRVARDSFITDEHGVKWFCSEQDIFAWAREEGKEVRPPSGSSIDLDEAQSLISSFPDAEACREFLDVWNVLRDFSAASQFSKRFTEIDQASIGTYERMARAGSSIIHEISPGTGPLQEDLNVARQVLATGLEMIDSELLKVEESR